MSCMKWESYLSTVEVFLDSVYTLFSSKGFLRARLRLAMGATGKSTSFWAAAPLSQAKTISVLWLERSAVNELTPSGETGRLKAVKALCCRKF